MARDCPDRQRGADWRNGPPSSASGGPSQGRIAGGDAVDREYESLMQELQGGAPGGEPRQRIEAGPGGYDNDPRGGYGEGERELKPWQRGPTGGPAPWQRQGDDRRDNYQRDGGAAPPWARGGDNYGGYNQGGYGGPPGGGPPGGGPPGGGPAPWQQQDNPPPPPPPAGGQYGYGGYPGAYGDSSGGYGGQQGMGAPPGLGGGAGGLGAPPGLGGMYMGYGANGSGGAPPPPPSDDLPPPPPSDQPPPPPPPGK